MKFRKKPVEIEAVQILAFGDTSLFSERPTWLIDALSAGIITIAPQERDYAWDIHTLEGVMRAQNGDWIIRGVEGELYAIKPDIFTKTYEAVV